MLEGKVSFSSSVFLADGGFVSFDRSQVLHFTVALGTDLAGRGIRREDRVAIVLPDGAKLCIAFLGVSCHCIAAPLNPAASLPDMLLARGPRTLCYPGRRRESFRSL